jgi:hypothetical protein
MVEDFDNKEKGRHLLAIAESAVCEQSPRWGRHLLIGGALTQKSNYGGPNALGPPQCLTPMGLGGRHVSQHPPSQWKENVGAIASFTMQLLFGNPPGINAR